MAGSRTANIDYAEEVERHGSIRKAAAAVGMSYSTFRKWHDRQSRGVEIEYLEKPAPVRKATGGLTLNVLLKRYTPTQQVIAAIEALPDEYIMETDLRGQCPEISMAGWDRMRRNEKLQGYRLRLPDGAYVWGRKRDIDLLKKRLMEG